MRVRLKYVTNYSNDELVTKSSTVPDCLTTNELGRAAGPARGCCL